VKQVHFLEKAMTQGVELTGYRPGGLGRTVELHGRYYGAEWNFDLAFEADIAADLAAFLTRLDPARDGFWLAWLDGIVVGSITIDGDAADSAHLRWFIAEPGITGRGIGASLMSAAMNFSRDAGYSRVWLTTFAGLDAARKLYDRHGFVETSTFEKTDWDFPITMQTLECAL
jgi:GNAT superfamily N-acetyltransferase